MLDVPCWMLGSRNCCDVTQACSPMPPGFEPLPFGNSRAESQRDSAPKPRVASRELPWEKRVMSAKWWGCGPMVERGRNPVGVEDRMDANPG